MLESYSSSPYSSFIGKSLLFMGAMLFLIFGCSPPAGLLNSDWGMVFVLFIFPFLMTSGFLLLSRNKYQKTLSVIEKILAATPILCLLSFFFAALSWGDPQVKRQIMPFYIFVFMAGVLILSIEIASTIMLQHRAARPLMAVGIISIVVVSGASVALSTNTFEQHSGFYYITITTTTEYNYKVLLPIPKDSRIAPFLYGNYLVANNTADLLIIDTEYGRVLEVKSNTSLNIGMTWYVNYTDNLLSSPSHIEDYSYTTSISNKALVYCEKASNTSIKILTESAMCWKEEGGWGWPDEPHAKFYAICNASQIPSGHLNQGDPFRGNGVRCNDGTELNNGWQQVNVYYGEWWSAID